MVVVLLVGGIVFFLAGLLAVVVGIPVKEFSFGNTLILAGAILACTGAMLVGLWIVLRELKTIAGRLGLVSPGSRARAALPSLGPGAAPGDQAPDDSGFPATEMTSPVDPASPPPWQEQAVARPRSDGSIAPEPTEPAPAEKPRRNLLFSSSSRKERERAQTPDAPAPGPQPAPAIAPPVAEPAEPPATFDDAWPKSERTRPADAPPRRPVRAPSTSAEPAPAPGVDRFPPLPRVDEQPQVTVLKSGVVDGMAYSLYSDGSIEAQMPEGMMRFASIDELRAHLEHRP